MVSRCKEAPAVGTMVRVAHPTGGVRPDDRFEVVEPPEGKDDRFVWVVFRGEPRYVADYFTRNGRALGFHYSSLVPDE